MDILEWLQEWYLTQCNGDWEHQNGVRISTLDNPGWRVSVSLVGTTASEAATEPYGSDNGDDDWVSYEIINAKFDGRGDPTKLIFLLESFRRLAEST